MPISERTLKKWRREALYIVGKGNEITRTSTAYDLAVVVLKLTQELLDQALLKGGKK